MAQAGIMHAAPWNAATPSIPPPSAPRQPVPVEAPWNKPQEANPPQASTAAKPAPGVAPPWVAGKQPSTRPEPEHKTLGKPDSARNDMPWKRKETKLEESSKDLPWTRKGERSSSSTRDSERSGRERRPEKRDVDHREHREPTRRPLGRERDDSWSATKAEIRKTHRAEPAPRALATIDLTRSPETSRSAAPWHKKAPDEIPHAPWSGSGKKPPGAADAAPWTARRSGPGKPVEPGHTYKLVLDARDQRSWKSAQADFVRCMVSIVFIVG